MWIEISREASRIKESWQTPPVLFPLQLNNTLEFMCVFQVQRINNSRPTPQNWWNQQNQQSSKKSRRRLTHKLKKEVVEQQQMLTRTESSGVLSSSSDVTQSSASFVNPMIEGNLLFPVIFSGECHHLIAVWLLRPASSTSDQLPRVSFLDNSRGCCESSWLRNPWTFVRQRQELHSNQCVVAKITNTTSMTGSSIHLLNKYELTKGPYVQTSLWSIVLCCFEI